MPFANFDSVKTAEDVVHLFETQFPDALKLMGRDLLLKDYFANPTGALVTVKVHSRTAPVPAPAPALDAPGSTWSARPRAIAGVVACQCAPYHYKDSVVIMGDAAHAMVPFYGQGMNAGFQDVLVFDKLLDEMQGNLAQVLPTYTDRRHPDAVAICDLALYNYVEMRSKVQPADGPPAAARHVSRPRAHRTASGLAGGRPNQVTSPLFLLQRKVEAWMHFVAPRRIIPLYSMVSFTEIPYSEAMRRWKRQIRLVNWGLATAAMATAASVAVAGAFLYGRAKRS